MTTNKSWKLLLTYMVIPRLLWRGHVKSLPGKFQKLPTVTTTLQKTSDSDQKREHREKCQRIIDYVFGNGPFPYSDIKGVNEFYEEDIAQIIAQQKQNTDYEKQAQNKEDETVRTETVVTSEDQPEIISIHKDKKAPSSDNLTESQANDEEVHSTVVHHKDAKSSTNDFITSLPHSEVQSPKANNIQELDSDNQWKISNTTITPKPFKLRLINPLGTCHHKITDTKCQDKINTSDDEFLYENSCGEGIRKELTKITNKMAKSEIISNVPRHRENTQDNNVAENEVKAIDIKKNEVKSHKISINKFTYDNTENPRDRLIRVTNEKQNNNLKLVMENPTEMQLINTPDVQHKDISNKTTLMKNVESSYKTKPNSDKHFVSKAEARKFQSNHNSIGDGVTIEIELCLPTNESQGSWNLYKPQSNEMNNRMNAKLHVSNKENKNARNLLLPLSNHGQNDPTKITPRKEPSTDAREEVLLHCNKTTSTELMGMEAPGIGNKDTIKTMNYKRQLKYKELKMGQQTNEKQNNNLKPIVENPAEMQLINMPHVQHKVISNKTTAMKNVKSSSKTKPNSDKDFVSKTEARKLQNNYNSIVDGGTTEIELFLATNRSQESWNSNKPQSNKVNNSINATLNISNKEDKNARNLLLHLINHGQNDPDKITPRKEPPTDARKEELLHCNTTSTKPMSMKALRIGTKDTVESMNDERQLKYKEHKMDQGTKNNGNPLENVVYDPHTYHFDYFSKQLQTQVPVKAVEINNQDSKIYNQNLSKESEEKLLTAHVTPVLHSGQLLQNDKVDNFPIPHASLSEQEKYEFSTFQQYPRQSVRSTSHRHPVEMFSPNNFFIQNRPAIPASNDYMWKSINPPKSQKQTNNGDKPEKSPELNHAQCLQQQWNPTSSKKEPATEHDTNPILGPDDASIQQSTVQTHEYNPRNKPEEISEPIILMQPGPDSELEPKLQKLISKENMPLKLQNRQEEKQKLEEKREHYINHEYEEDTSTPVKKQLSESNTPETTDSKTQQEKEYEFNECPIPEFKVTNDMPLSELLRVIRLRNQFLLIKEFLESVEMSKCGDKKPECPPKAPVCPQPPPPCPPVQESPPTPPPPPPPCTPLPTKPKPPPKCDCKCKYVAVKDIFNDLPRRISERYNIDTPAAESEPFEQQELEHVWIDNGRLFANPFDSWVPVPNYPYPKKKVVTSVGCDPRCVPKKNPIYVKPKEKSCTGFPKRLCFSNRTSKNFILLWNKD